MDDTASNTPNDGQQTPPVKSGGVEQSVAGQTEQADTSTTTSSGVVQPPMEPPKPKRKFSKRTLFIIVGALIFILGVIFLIRAIANRGGSKNEIVWWGIQYEESVLNELIEEYEEKNPGVRIKYFKQSPKDYRERLKSALLKSSGPDILQLHNTWTPMFVEELSTIPNGVYSDTEFSSTFYRVVLNDVSTGNGFAGIPLSFDALTLFVNDEIFEREGKEYPVTWEDVTELSGEMTKRDENGVITQAGIALGTTGNIDHWEEILGLLFLQNGASLARPEGELSDETLNFYISFGAEEVGSWDSTMPNSTTAFSTGKLAMYLAPTRRSNEIVATNPSLRFKTITLPQIAKATPDQPDMSYATYWYEGVSSNSKKSKESWKFLKFLSEKENLEKLHSRSSVPTGIYPRVDMRESQLNDSVLGSVARLAPSAASWYLASGTEDGDEGLNSLVGNAYKTAINGLSGRTSPKKVKIALVEGLAAALQKYFDF